VDKLEKIAKKYFKKSEVVYVTSDKVPFLDYSFAKRHADKNGLELKEFKKPKKKLKNGIK
jgi:hypothetical protein